MARNGVAANLLMVFLLVAGFAALGSMVQEVFPEFSLDTVEVTVRYPGATPEEVEESILQKIEEQVEAVEGVEEITATAAEGFGTVAVELKQSADISRALDDIKAEVDQITSFPENAENPEVRERTNRQSVIRILVYGDVSERAIKETAYRLEDELASLDEVSFVATTGVRDYEISIEIDRRRLQAYGLTLQDVAREVARGSLDLPAGSIETSDEQIRVRTLGQNYNQQQFEDIVLISQPDGTEIRLGQVARVIDGFEDTDLATRFNGQPAAMVEVFRTSNERVLDIVEAITPYLENEFQPSLPAGIEYSIWENSAEMLEERINLLLKNAGLGLLLVVIALALFLHIYLAFWTAVGILIAFIGTLGVMFVLGVSINQMSLFGFILAIGIVVDDAIVVGENIFAEREGGRRGITASIVGARRIARPVTFAVLTTIVAFVPLLFVPGLIGSFLDPIPFVVISVLALSLIESLFILPNHLSHLPGPGEPLKNPVLKRSESVRHWVDDRLQKFIKGPLKRALEFSTGAPSIVIASSLAAIILTVSLIPAGIVRVEFLPAVEGDYIIARVELPEGSAFADTRKVVTQLESTARATVEELASGSDQEGGPPLLKGLYTVVGQESANRGPQGETGLQAPHLATVVIRLPSADNRDVSALAVENLWRNKTGAIPATKSLTFSANLVDIGAPAQVEVSHPEQEKLSEISERVVTELRSINGVFDVESDLDQGLREVQLKLKPAARSLGISLEYLAQSVRAAFFGQEALRIQRGREEVRVYVRLPESQRDAIEDVRDYRIRTPGGRFVAVSELAEVSIGRSPARISRKDGQRVVTVTGDVNPQVVTGNAVAEQLEKVIMPAIQADYPALGYAFGGEQEEQAQSFGALGKGFLLVLCVIYALLAIPFRSYVQPLVVMAAIPFGIIGAVIGHLLLDLPVGMLSVFGIIGLSGVVINDALVMIDFINEKRREGMDAREAIIEGAQQRFRPIMLTSLTTFLSVTPLVLETSFQAQFLIPMAASIGFGIIFATAILMLLVPALAMVEYKLVGARRDRKENSEDQALATDA